MDDEHRYAGTVLAWVEGLCRLEKRGIETFHLNLTENLDREEGRWKQDTHTHTHTLTHLWHQLVPSHVTVIDDPGGEKGDKAVENLCVSSPAGVASD